MQFPQPENSRWIPSSSSRYNFIKFRGVFNTLFSPRSVPLPLSGWRNALKRLAGPYIVDKMNHTGGGATAQRILVNPLKIHTILYSVDPNSTAPRTRRRCRPKGHLQNQQNSKALRNFHSFTGSLLDRSSSCIPQDSHPQHQQPYTVIKKWVQ